jgi:hypothetical protein
MKTFSQLVQVIFEAAGDTDRQSIPPQAELEFYAYSLALSETLRRSLVYHRLDNMVGCSLVTERLIRSTWRPRL